jgi:phage/plasmid-like protein (TIGR03299 family)
MSDHKTLGPCGPAWKPVQNVDSLNFFKKFTEAGHMSMETAGSLEGGKQVWGLANLNKSITLPGDDVVDGHLLLSNPHVWGKSMTIMFTPIRVVCMNTLMMALSSGGQRYRHLHSVEWSQEAAEKAEEALGIGSLLTEQFGDVASQLAEKHVDDNIIKLFIAKQMSPQAVTMTKKSADIDMGKVTRNYERVMELVKTSPGAKLKSSEGTLWGAVNAVTYFYDHVYGNSVDGRLTNAWFGANQRKKKEAWEDAQDFLKMVA